MESSINPTKLFAQVIRQAAVDDAWEQAVQSIPALLLLGVTGGSLKEAMANAVDEAMAAGVVDLEELTKAALAKVPKMRSPNGRTSQNQSD